MNLRNVSVFHMFRCFSKNIKVAVSLRACVAAFVLQRYAMARWHVGTIQLVYYPCS